MPIKSPFRQYPLSSLGETQQLEFSSSTSLSSLLKGDKFADLRGEVIREIDPRNWPHISGSRISEEAKRRMAGLEPELVTAVKGKIGRNTAGELVSKTSSSKSIKELILDPRKIPKKHLKTAGRIGAGAAVSSLLFPGGLAYHVASSAAYETGSKIGGKGVKGLVGGLVASGLITAGAAMFSGSSFSASDDYYNTIEGMHPGSQGFGAQSIRQHTDFGSGWIGLAALETASLGRLALSKTSGNIMGDEYKRYEKIRKRNAELSKEGRIQGIQPGINKFAGMSNTGSMASYIRGRITEFKEEFASRWDPLKKIAAELFEEAGEGSFKKMLGSQEFKGALAAGKQEKLLGEGFFGKAYLMSGTLKGKEFKFVRKVGDIGEFEAQAMKAGEETVAPSVYSLGKDSLDMEYFSGTTLGELSSEQLKSIKPEISKVFEKIHKTGFEHGDPHLGNLMLVKTNKGSEIGALDFGNARRLSSYGNEEAALSAAQKDVSIAMDLTEAKISNKSQIQALDPFAQQATDPFAAADPFAQQVPTKNVLDELDKFNTQEKIKRKQRFQQASQQSVGASFRAAHNAGRGHGGFNSTG